jgi:hypothetical protein
LLLNFADQNLDHLRFVPLMGKWFVWDGKRWEMDVRLIARERVKDTCRQAAQRCNKLKMAKLIASARTVSSAMHLGQCDQRIVAVAEDWDRDPWLLNTPDGTVDLRNGKSKSHDPKDFITKVTGVSPDFEMATPLWNAFLGKITADSEELQAYLQRMTGYELTGITREHALFFAYGTGANGKSTFKNAVTPALAIIIRRRRSKHSPRPIRIGIPPSLQGCGARDSLPPWKPKKEDGGPKAGLSSSLAMIRLRRGSCDRISSSIGRSSSWTFRATISRACDRSMKRSGAGSTSFPSP